MTNTLNSQLDAVTYAAVTQANLTEISDIISASHSALRHELSQTPAAIMSNADQTLLRMGEPDVNYAFADTLKNSGINHINLDESRLTDPRAAIAEIYQSGEDLLREKGLPNPDISFYHRAAEQSEVTGREMQDVLSEMRSSQPLMMRTDLDPQQTIQTLPQAEVLFTQAQDRLFAGGRNNQNTAREQQAAPGAFKGGTNYCKASAPDVNLENHSPKGNLVDANAQTIRIYPRAGSVPSITIPNTVGADGFSTWNLNDHVYNVYTNTRGKNLTPEAVNEALRNNPTPGNDRPATPNGTRNNVGPIDRPWPMSDYAFKNGNWVRSFEVPSPDPEKFTNIYVNYTIKGEHLLHEGYVIRYGVIEDGKVVGLRSYGEGHAWEQSEQLRGLWCGEGKKVWSDNHKEIIDEASAGVD